jgi:predicted AlkP superfamily phosphohydrolase/phosphomutase
MKKGRDDILNGLSLCHLHHWAFDAGWLTLQDNFKIQASSKVSSLSADFGILGNYMISSGFFRIIILNFFFPKERKFILIKKQLFGIEKTSFVIK